MPSLVANMFCDKEIGEHKPEMLKNILIMHFNEYEKYLQRLETAEIMKRVTRDLF